MTILILTDSHYGWKKSKAFDLDYTVSKCSKLSNEKFGEDITKIILLGDIFDLWRRDITIINNEQKHNFDYILDNKKDIVYCIGNHDYALVKAKPLNGVVTKYFNYNGILFIHGYQPDVIVDMPFITLHNYENMAFEYCFTPRDIKSIISMAYSEINGILTRHGHLKTSSGLSRVLTYSALEYGNVIMGHFHKYGVEFVAGNTAVSLKAHCDNYAYLMYDNTLYEVDLNKNKVSGSTIIK